LRSVGLLDVLKVRLRGPRSRRLAVAGICDASRRTLV